MGLINDFVQMIVFPAGLGFREKAAASRGITHGRAACENVLRQLCPRADRGCAWTAPFSDAGDALSQLDAPVTRRLDSPTENALEVKWRTIAKPRMILHAI